jgi:hypothetical protein
MSNITKELRYRVTAERFKKFTTTPGDGKAYSAKFQQDFKTTSEAFKKYFELVPEFQEVQLIDLVQQKTVVLND